MITESQLRSWLSGSQDAEAATGEISAAVLVLFVGAPLGQSRLLLTKRTQTVQTHKGQVSFPGGMREPGDHSLEQTALRESAEEVGLSVERVRVLGRLPLVHTRGALPIVPWVGALEGEFNPRLNPHEVEKLLWLPVTQLLTEGLGEHQVSLGAVTVRSPGIHLEGELVWGATARILEALRGLMVRGLSASGTNPAPIPKGS